jgi:serine/threonine protein kinase
MLNDDLKARVQLEKSALQKARHRNVVELLQTLEDEHTCVLVMENCVNGNLVRQVALRNKDISDTVFPLIIKPVLLGLQYMHIQVRLPCSLYQLSR